MEETSQDIGLRVIISGFDIGQLELLLKMMLF